MTIAVRVSLLNASPAEPQIALFTNQSATLFASGIEPLPQASYQIRRTTRNNRPVGWNRTNISRVLTI